MVPQRLDQNATIKFTKRDMKAIRAAAGARGMRVSVWMRTVLVQAATIEQAWAPMKGTNGGRLEAPSLPPGRGQ
jgi:alkanesulfonate monooxygenase SsuD/methylene tetrahydromethanopterin reductase-like flavin-dependent oxidoreductase (luciferase family)